MLRNGNLELKGSNKPDLTSNDIQNILKDME